MFNSFTLDDNSLLRIKFQFIFLLVIFSASHFKGYGKLSNLTPLSSLKLEQTIGGVEYGKLKFDKGTLSWDLLANASSGLRVAFQSSDTTIARIKDDELIILSVGTTTITAFQKGDGLYNAAREIQIDLQSKPLRQIIDFASVPDVPLEKATLTLSAQASSKLPIEFSSQSPNAIVKDSIVQLLGEGITIITARQKGNNLFLPAEKIMKFTVLPRTQNTLGLIDPVASIDKESVEVLEKSGQNTFNIYPNPTRDILFVKLNIGNIEECWLSIWDIKGTKMLESKIANELSEIEVKELNGGIYTVLIKGNGFVSTLKFIKK